MEIIFNLILIIVGCFAIIFRKKFTHESLEPQRKAFGINYSKEDETWSKVFAPVVGLAIILFAIFNLVK